MTPQNIPPNTTCPNCRHVLTGCDEDCRDCGQCYPKEACNKTCPHAPHEDDGGFFIDGNHPDDMFSVGGRR
jgi:hypothetical protein